LPASFCQFCGARINGQPRTFHHPKWARDLSLRVCEQCAQQKPRCRVCELPMANAAPNGVCETCNRYQRYCFACGQAIQGNTARHVGAGHYCEDCSRVRSPCDVCGAPLTDAQWRLSDGRVTCAYCHASAIYDPSEAAALYAEMKAILDRLLGMRLNVPTGLALVDRNQLGEIIFQQRESMRNNSLEEANLDPQQTLGLYARRGIRRGIYVQTGLPRMLYLQVAAHEYAHAWQGENCPLLKDLLVREGFAEWVAYRVLGDYGYTHGQERMRSRVDIYGQGLKWMLDVEASQGVEGVYRACCAVP